MGLRRCAVAASAMDAGKLCRVLEALGYAHVLTARDGEEALSRVRGFSVEALVTDAVLPRIDGAELIRRAYAMPLAVYPMAALIVPAGFRVPDIPCCAVVHPPVSRSALEAALASQTPALRQIPAQKRRLASDALASLGVPAHRGADCLARAVELAWLDARYLRGLTTRLYPAVGAEFGMTGRAVERAIRYVIDDAWRRGEIEAQYRLFGNTIDARRGCPTCSEMIARIADILRWEGRA